MYWKSKQQRALEQLQEAVTWTPALSPPDLEKSFQLYVNEKQRITLGFLTQTLGSTKRPIGYDSKELDAVA